MDLMLLVADLKLQVADLIHEVAGLRMEVPELRPGEIRLNLTTAYSITKLWQITEYELTAYRYQ